ncbi:MAG: Lrp/AsnC family transcriptional regulator [Thermoplasmata archaeon]|jgi:DNA-binding Lrp family transcriptional regulator|nr:Lrp/AsnC family transcriptional regulator [Thermoplasmata archaeon]
MKEKEKVAGSVELDELDIDILRSLNDNARKSFRDIAKELQVSLTTVSNRVKAMERHGVIQGYMPIIEPTKLGFDIMVVIGVKVVHGRIVETERDLAKDPAVFAVFDSTGDWDAIIMARFKNRGELNVFVKKVLDHENVDRTYTQVVLNVTKDEKRVLV